jgi:hypothetical protein
MRLEPDLTQPDASLDGRVTGEHVAGVMGHSHYNRETIGQPRDVWPLIVQLLGRFVGLARDSETWRRRTQNMPEPER